MKFWEFFTSNGYIYEIIFAFLPMLPLLKWRKGWLFGLIPSLIFIVVISFFIYGKMTEGNLFLSSLYYICIFSFLTFTVEICSEDGWINAFFISTCALIFQHIFYLFFRTAEALFVSLNIEGVVLDVMVYAVLMLAVYTALYFLFVKKIKKDENVKVNKIGLGAVFLLAFLFIVPANTYFQRLFTGMGEQYGLPNVVYGLTGIVVCVGFLFVLFCLEHGEKMKEDMKILKSLREADRRQYEVFKQSMETLNIKYHDLKYSISNAKAAEVKDKQWVEETSQALDVCGSMQKTGNETLDVILVEKRFQCDALEITFDATVIDGSLLSAMEEVDIYTIFGNAIDNAIECLQKAPKEKRLLRVNLNHVNGMAKIQIENYTSQAIDMENGFPESSKKIKGTHGFGVKSIARTIKKYNGIIHYTTEDDMFILTIIFPYNQ